MSQITKFLTIGSAVNTLSGDVGGNITPSGNNIVIAGGSNINTVGDALTSTITINLLNTVTISGDFTTTNGDITADDGNIICNLGNFVGFYFCEPVHPTVHRIEIDPFGAITINTPTAGVGLTIAGGGLKSTGQTQLASLTTGVLQAGATGIVSSTALTNGQMIIGSTGAAPVAGAISSTGYLSVTGGAGTLNIDTIPVLQRGTGFYSWGGAGAYYDDTVLGSFSVLRPGTCYINGLAVNWSPTTLTGLATGTFYYIYVDATGTILKTTTTSAALRQDAVVLFECLRDSTAPANTQLSTKEVHPYDFSPAISEYMHDIVGTVIDNVNDGANITLSGTVKLTIAGDDVLSEHGTYAGIWDTGATAVTWYQYFSTGASVALYAHSDTFTSNYNNAGTITALPAGKFGVYRLYLTLNQYPYPNVTSRLVDGDPVYIAYFDETFYDTEADALAAIAAGSIASVSATLLEHFDPAQLGYIVFDQAAGNISEVVISKTTLRQTLSTAGTTVAASVTTNTTNFDGILNPAVDVNVQAALETIDDWGKTATNHGILVGRGVNTPIVASVLTDGQILIGVTGADPNPHTLTAGAGITIDDSTTPGEIIIASTTTGLTWADAVADTNAAVNSGYITKHATPANRLVYTLPAVAAIGNEIKIKGYTAGGWQVKPAAGDVIYIGDTVTALPVVAGSGLLSVNAFDGVTLTCITANSEWQAEATNNLTVV